MARSGACSRWPETTPDYDIGAPPDPLTSQVKNPQGSSTFSGAFSSLTDDARRVLGDAATSQTGGGMFWMTWNEFRREFNRVYVCHWATALSACVQSSWTATTSGGCTDYASCRTNPIFVAAGGVVAIGLQQRDRRFGRPNEPITYPMIGVTILRSGRRSLGGRPSD